MSWKSWVQGLLPVSAPRAPQRRLRRSIRPALFLLEDRLTPSHTVDIAVVDPPATLFEGVAINLTSTVTGATAPTYDWQVTKDGAPFQSGTDTTFSFTPDDNASYIVTLTVTDGVEAVSDSATFAVANQVPTADVSGPTSGALNQSLTFTLTATDVAGDTGAGFTYNIDWNNDGAVDETVLPTANNGAGVSVTHAFATPGINTFSVTATDEDGGTSTPATHTVAISGAAVINGVLTVGGTSGNDVIHLIPKGPPRAQNTNVRVFLNGAKLGVFTGVNSINIVALEGHDWVQLAGAIRVPATIDGGAGNDHIKGGKGGDLLIGGDGDDWLNGHQGRDVLIGGDGVDRLLGGPGDDLLIAGATTYDTDAAALASLLATWNGSGNYDQRVASLTDATAAVRLVADGTSPTVLDDGDADRLTGAAGKDWFLATVGQDAVTDQHAFEFLNGAKKPKPGKPNHGSGNGKPK